MHIYSWLIDLNSENSNDLKTEVNSITSDSVSLSVEVSSNDNLSKENPDESSKYNDNISSKVEVISNPCAQINKPEAKTELEYYDEGKMKMFAINHEIKTKSINKITTPTHSGDDYVCNKVPIENCKPKV